MSTTTTGNAFLDRLAETGASTRAVNTADERYSQLVIGACPDQWGVWFPSDPQQIDPMTCLDEMAEAGFEVLETGPFGYFPTDPEVLARETAARGLTVVAGTGWGILHKEEAWAETERTFRAIGATHAALGAEFVVHLPPLFRDDKTWELTDERTLSPSAWRLYVENANRLGRIMKEDYGLTMVLHPHGDSHIETPEDIDRIFSATDPELVSFCLDTGHVVYGQGDPVEIIREYPDRIGYVHIKAMDEDLVQQAHDEDWPFGQAVAKGCSVRPPAGKPEMGPLIDELATLGRPLYVVCEQDMYPCDPSYPLPNAIETRRHLASLGLGTL
ncbi:TIM barrel protein [Auraticoccus monumenti]|nr:TIM barrel protein [Auraticoccus monumenti]